MKQYILFDLDGTLTDSKLGITTCVQYALHKMGIEEPDLDKLEPFIGPPLKDSFMLYYGMDDKQALQAVEWYRERYRDIGIFENRVYDGILPMLRTLQAKGLHLAVASNKPTNFVVRILEHFHMDKYFEVVLGSEIDGRRASKKEVIQDVLLRLSADKPVPKNKIYMIGDRKYDIEAAKALHIDSVGVTYGYGDVEELKEAHADYIVRTVDELKRFLMRGMEEDRSKATPFQKIWLILYNLLLFIVLRSFVNYLAQWLFLEIGGYMTGGTMVGGVLDTFLTTRDEAGELVDLSANAKAAALVVGNIAASLAVLRTAKFVLGKTAEDMHLTHLKGEPVSNYILLGLATLGAVFGLNMFCILTQMTANSEAYMQVEAMQAGVSVGMGILCYGIVAPLAEELLFRGILFNYMRRFFNIRIAVFVSAMIFSGFHMNGVQGLYAFCMGCLLAYAYEYFGDFKVPVAMHILANLLAFLLGKTGLFAGAFVSWPCCLFFLLLGGICLYYLVRQKNVL